jgi:hypothetical protein
MSLVLPLLAFFAVLALGFASSSALPSLQSTLLLTLENQGVIYVSLNSSTIVRNSLLLNIKNIGQQPLCPQCNATGGGVGPTVKFSFVYGLTSGCLGPADWGTGIPFNITAWNTAISLADDQSPGGWTYENPTNPTPNTIPVWIAGPSETNAEILGTGSEANVLYQFDNVIAPTVAPAHTQLYAQFSRFPGYSDTLFVLDIIKRYAL